MDGIARRRRGGWARVDSGACSSYAVPQFPSGVEATALEVNELISIHDTSSRGILHIMS